MKPYSSLRLNLLDPAFSQQMTRYYQWMTAFGILLFGSTFLMAGCIPSGCLQLSVGITCLPPLRKKIAIRWFRAIRLGLVILSLLLCVVGHGS